MNRIEQYRAHLQQMCDWESFLLAESGLPGPRANLELARAAADEGDEAQFRRWLTLGSPADSPAEFLALCGVLGLGRLLAEGDRAALPALRAAANDPRRRVRDGVVAALQRWGEADMAALMAEMEAWSHGSRLEQQAAVAALRGPDTATGGERMTAFAIRPMTLDDYDAVLALMRGQPGVSVRAADSREAIGRYLERNPGLSLVAESDGRLAGCVFCGHDGRRGALYHVVVASTFRRAGIGREMVTRALDGLLAAGIAKTHIDVFADNEAAIAFWLRLGWDARDDLRRFSFIHSADPNA